MPIATVSEPLRKRRQPHWPRLLPGTVLMFGALAYPWVRPLPTGTQHRRGLFGRTVGYGYTGQDWIPSSTYGSGAYRLPGGEKTGWHVWLGAGH